MADDNKLLIKAGWFQFLLTQIFAFLIYSLGLAYWFGGMTAKIDQLDKTIVAHESKISDLNKYDTEPGRITTQVTVQHEHRIQTLEDTMAIIRPKIDVIAEQVNNIDKKIDKMSDRVIDKNKSF